MLSKSEAKYIQTLSQKKLRDAEKRFIIEGPKMVVEAVNNKYPIEKLYAVEDWVNDYSWLFEGIQVETIAPFELEKISQLKTPNKVLGIAHIVDSKHFVFNNEDLTLALDGIQDPGNMGTIIRIADWFGISQIICSRDCADAYNPKVVQATMGSVFRVAMLYTDLAQWIQDQSPTDFYAAALNGTPLEKFKKIQSGVIVIGNESKGIRADVLSLIQKRITIEKRGQAESLNAAVATGIILSHLR